MAMIDDLEKESEVSGMFKLPTGEKASGTLNFAGEESYLYLWGEKLSDLSKRLDPVFSIEGILSSGDKVSLINCTRISAHYSKPLTNFSFSFDFAVFGRGHISHEEKKIEKVSFTIDDTESLFYEPEVFGAIVGGYISPARKEALPFPPWDSSWPDMDARPLVEQILQSEGVESNTEVGANPVIFYHTGKTHVLETDSVLGKISVSRSDPVEAYVEFLGSYESEGNSGVNIENAFSITLEFDDMLVLEDAVSKALQILRFFELLIGHSQNFTSFVVKKSGTPKALRIYGCRFPAHKRFGHQPYFPLFSAVKNPEQFSRIMANWLQKDTGRWREARDRYFSCFHMGWNYDVDRLVAAANMFDLLPPEAFPDRPGISEDLESARDKCQRIFRNLPDSPDRQSVLSELGRVGKNISLKRKIRHRAQLVIDQIGGDRMPKLLKTADEAVNCRNRYVHGPKDDNGQNYGPEKIRFLTETLEFVFTASDLLEAGWDMKAWSLENGYPDHPLLSCFLKHSGDSGFFGRPCFIPHPPAE